MPHYKANFIGEIPLKFHNLENKIISCTTVPLISKWFLTNNFKKEVFEEDVSRFNY